MGVLTFLGIPSPLCRGCWLSHITSILDTEMSTFMPRLREESTYHAETCIMLTITPNEGFDSGAFARQHP